MAELFALTSETAVAGSPSQTGLLGSGADE
jgi:hypothetical protein